MVGSRQGYEPKALQPMLARQLIEITRFDNSATGATCGLSAQTESPAIRSVPSSLRIARRNERDGLHDLRYGLAQV